MSNEQKNGRITSKRDCFVKMDKYTSQSEWRLALYRGIKSTEAYTLEIGSIRDIATLVKTDKLADLIDGMFKNGSIKPGLDRYEGNIGRKEMSELFFRLGDNKADLFVVLTGEDINKCIVEL